MVRRMNTIQGEWDSYAEHVMPSDAPRVQRQETRRAFYAGYMSAMLQITQVAHSVAGGQMSDAAGKGIVDGLREELAAFASAVNDGRE